MVANLLGFILFEGIIVKSCRLTKGGPKISIPPHTMMLNEWLSDDQPAVNREVGGVI